MRRVAGVETAPTGVMPAEWSAHERCLMAWPARPELWGPHAAAARAEYAATANAIAAFEPVTMVAAPWPGGRGARGGASAAVDVVEIPIDDSWLRDAGPIIVLDQQGQRTGVDFQFNSWGEKFLPFDRDAAVAQALLAQLGIPRVASAMVLEGGAITVDGEGTLITTEQCLLNPNRNPGMSREQIEAELRRTLGVAGGHLAALGAGMRITTPTATSTASCTYVRPGVVLAQTCDDPANPNFPPTAANLEVLRSARDAAAARSRSSSCRRSRTSSWIGGHPDDELPELLHRERRRHRADRGPSARRGRARDHRRARFRTARSSASRAG